MNEAAKEARRAYRREWARKNPDKVKASTERYWERKAAEMRTEGLAADNTNSTDESEK